MSQDLPCVSFMALYVISLHIMQTNSRSSTHWKLNMELGKVQSADDDELLSKFTNDPMMDILSKQLVNTDSNWEVLAADGCGEFCESGVAAAYEPHQEIHLSEEKSNLRNANDTKSIKKTQNQQKTKTTNPALKKTKKEKNLLDCGTPVNSTQYDSLRGILHRNMHPSIPEPDVAMIFRKRSGKNNDVNMNELEKKLRKDKREKPKCSHVYNQIGNFWRIKGNTQLSIECFRKALSINSENPDVLLNLARVLFNLQYLDDAIFLTRRSLELLPPKHNSWLQHFTLGEILKAYGHTHEATLHLRKTLDLNPGFQPAEAHLREMETSPDISVTYYTLCIILMLVLVVLCGILSSNDGVFEELADGTKTQRHFNRAMAMRSIKLGINPKLIRMRKQMAQAYN